MESDLYMKAMFGEHARHAAFNYILQPSGNNNAAVLGITSHADKMAFGASLESPHILVLCDVIIRPHLVIESSHLVGSGASGVLKSGFADIDSWLEKGKVILNNTKK